METLKIYLLSQEENTGYDTYSECIVCATNVEDAKNIRPDSKEFIDGVCADSYEWATNINNITCEEIGIANHNTREGVILSSYHAG